MDGLLNGVASSQFLAGYFPQQVLQGRIAGVLSIPCWILPAKYYSVVNMLNVKHSQFLPGYFAPRARRIGGSISSLNSFLDTSGIKIGRGSLVFTQLSIPSWILLNNTPHVPVDIITLNSFLDTSVGFSFEFGYAFYSQFLPGYFRGSYRSPRTVS